MRIENVIDSQVTTNIAHLSKRTSFYIDCSGGGGGTTAETSTAIHDPTSTTSSLNATCTHYKKLWDDKKIVGNVFFKNPFCPNWLWVGLPSQGTWAKCCVKDSFGSSSASKSMDCQIFSPLREVGGVFDDPFAAFKKSFCNYENPRSFLLKGATTDQRFLTGAAAFAAFLDVINRVWKKIKNPVVAVPHPNPLEYTGKALLAYLILNNILAYQCVHPGMPGEAHGRNFFTGPTEQKFVYFAMDGEMWLYLREGVREVFGGEVDVFGGKSANEWCDGSSDTEEQGDCKGSSEKFEARYSFEQILRDASKVEDLATRIRTLTSWGSETPLAHHDFL